MLCILLPLDDEVSAIGFDSGRLRFAMHSLDKPARLELRNRTAPCIVWCFFRGMHNNPYRLISAKLEDKALGRLVNSGTSNVCSSIKKCGPSGIHNGKSMAWKPVE